MEEKLLVFIDSIGRTIVGEKVSETDGKHGVKNPAMISVNVTGNPQNPQLQVQLMPLFLRELCGTEKDTVWDFSNIVPATTIDLDSKLVSQYQRIFSNIVIPEKPNLEGTPIVKLFD